MTPQNIQEISKENFHLKQENQRLSRIVAELTLKLSENQNLFPSNEINSGDILFCDFFKNWLDIHKKKVQLNTYLEYRKVLNTHIYPYFKEIGLCLSEISSDDIQDYYNYKLKQGAISPNTVLKHHANLFSCFKYAMKNHIITKNPMLDVSRPKHIKFTGNFYLPDQLIELFKQTKSSVIYTPILMAGLLGLRRSEILALEWNSINFDLGTITIQRKVMKDINNKNIISNRLKNDSSYRTLCMPQNLVDYLKKRRNEQLKKFKLDKQYNKYINYVCVQDSGELLTLNQVSDTFRRIMRKSSLPTIRFHDLRHSCATMLLYLGYNMKQIQEWMGHANFETTANIYTHADTTIKSKIAIEIGKSISLEL